MTDERSQEQVEDVEAHLKHVKLNDSDEHEDPGFKPPKLNEDDDDVEAHIKGPKAPSDT
jgi:hypothetical protein